MPCLQLFLQFGLEILELAVGLSDIFDLWLEKRQDNATCFLNSAVEVDGAQNSFKSVDKQRLLGSASCFFLALSQLKVLAQPDTFRIFDQVGRTYEKTL